MDILVFNALWPSYTWTTMDPPYNELHHQWAKVESRQHLMSILPSVNTTTPRYVGRKRGYTRGNLLPAIAMVTQILQTALSCCHVFILYRCHDKLLYVFMVWTSFIKSYMKWCHSNCIQISIHIKQPFIGEGKRGYENSYLFSIFHQSSTVSYFTSIIELVLHLICIHSSCSTNSYNRVVLSCQF